MVTPTLHRSMTGLLDVHARKGRRDRADDSQDGLQRGTVRVMFKEAVI